MNIPSNLVRIVQSSLELNRSLTEDLIGQYSGHKGHEEDIKSAQQDLAEIAQALALLAQ